MVYPKNSFNKIVKYIFLIALILLLFSLWYFNRPKTIEGIDQFAKCLAAKGITMYGANWCSHCQNEKKAFGKAFRFVPYVECPDNPKLCQEKGIRGYPTWLFPDGKKLEGEQGIKKLAEESGCSLYSF